MTSDQTKTVYQMVQEQVRLRCSTPDVLISEKKEREFEAMRKEMEQIVTDFHHNYDDFCARGDRALTFKGEVVISFEIQAADPHRNQTEDFWRAIWVNKEGLRSLPLSMWMFRSQVADYLLKFV